MAKADRVYFENLTAAADSACVAAGYLVECLEKYGTEDIKSMMNIMHEHEHAGDMKRHEMEAMLAKAFVTPIDREDLALISQNIDEVTDNIEEVLQGMYMYRIKAITPEAIPFAKKILECCKLMRQMLGEFINFKKPAKLHDLVIALNHMEEECDVLYIESTRALEEHFDNPLDVISWRKIYDRMESCADACEHIGDSVDMVVMKNS